MGRKRFAGASVLWLQWAVAVVLVAAWAVTFAAEGVRVSSQAPVHDDIVAVVNGKAINREHLQAVTNTLPTVRDRSSKELKEIVLKDLLEIEVFALDAQSLGYDREKSFLDRMQRIKKALLAVERKKRILAQVQVSDEEARKYYSGHSLEFGTPEKVKISEIFVPLSIAKTRTMAETKAERIRRRLVSGADFADVANEFSAKFRGTSYLPPASFRPEVAKVIFELIPGEISPPIWTTDGCVVIRVEDKLAAVTPSFEEVREEVISKVAQRKKQEVLEQTKESLFKRYQVKIYEDHIDGT